MTLAGTFAAGGELTRADQVLRDTASGAYYCWQGDLPKIVPVGASPDTTGGIGAGAWQRVGDVALQEKLSSASGAACIGSGVTVAFETVAEMKTATWLTARMNVITKGYFAVDDGGGATYVITAQKPAEIGYGNHVLQNGLYARICTNGTACLEQWGALANDATAAIQAAINAMPDVVSIKKRQYGISKTIYIPSDRKIDFSGSVIKFVGDEYVDYFMPDGSENNRNRNITIRNAVMRGFYTYGDNVLPTFNSQGHGNGVVCIRMKYCDGFVLENIDASGMQYGIEIKTSRYGKIINCKFHDNTDDGLSISDGGSVPVFSSNIIVEQCEAYHNGYRNNNIGNSGFEIDDGPHDITFIKCYAHDNESRGFDAHTHGGVPPDVMCYNITYLECVAENNNNRLQTEPAYPVRNVGFSFGSASDRFQKIQRVRLIRCKSSGHKLAGVLWEKTGRVTDDGLHIEGCELIENSAEKAVIATTRVSNIKIRNTAIYTKNARSLHAFDNRGMLHVNNVFISGSQAEAIFIEGGPSRVFISESDFLIPAEAARAAPVISAFNCALAEINHNRLAGGAADSAAPAISLGDTEATASKQAVITGNAISGVKYGVFTRYTTTVVTGNIFSGISCGLDNVINANHAVNYGNNIELNSAAPGEAKADASAGNVCKNR